MSAITDGWHLPHWVYRAYDADGALLYIGCTRNPEQRVQQWRSMQRRGLVGWVDLADRWTWREYPCHVDAILAERAAIQSEGPRYNHRHNGGQRTVNAFAMFEQLVAS